MNPVIVLTASGIISMFIGVYNLRRAALPFVVLACIVAFTLCITGWRGDFGNLLTGMLSFDSFSVAYSATMIIITAIILIISYHYYGKNVEHLADIYALFLFSLTGAILLVSYQNLVMLFIGIEILSIPLYILAASNRLNLASNEAGLKYFLTGSLASAFLLLGITLVYGTSGSFALSDIQQYTLANASHLPVLFISGIFLLLGAFIFKISAAPFHFWAPDVYQGSPTVITSFMATVVKIAAFGALIKFIEGVILQETFIWQQVLSFVAVLTMIVGNVIAVYQTNLKRLLAYSGVANAGYVMIAVATLGENSSAYILYYLTGYSIATILAFTVYFLVKEKNATDTIDGLKGLSSSNKILAIALCFAMLSLAGMPPLAGFFGKYVVFANAIGSGNIWLVIIAILNTLVGIYYYFKVMITTFQPSANANKIYISITYSVLLMSGVILLLILGIFPDLFFNLM